MAIEHLIDWSILINNKPLEQQSFNQAMQQAKPNLANTLHSISSALSTLEPIFRKLYSNKNKSMLSRQTELSAQINQHIFCLFSPAALANMPLFFFENLPRYCESIAIRLEKYQGKAAQDQNHQQQLQLYFDAIENGLNKKRKH